MATAPKAENSQSSSACPICGKPVAAHAAEQPFCSKRCRMADLHRWMDERYRISREVNADEELMD
jgi:endogenous inhibitor of DNA gyrase (YacG/DUF329 family)